MVSEIRIKCTYPFILEELDSSRAGYLEMFLQIVLER